MKIERRFTTAGGSAYDAVAFRKATSEIRNPDGSVVFRLADIDVPANFSQVAADVLAQKYFRKAGVAARLKRVKEKGVPSFLWRSVPDDAALADLPEHERFGGETTATQVFDRLAGAWTYWGWKGGYFASEDDAQAYMDEMRVMLARQMAAPNSPQWFNTGLHWAYGIDGPSQGHFYVDYRTGKLVASTSAYEHPQPHACFIQGVRDDLVNEGGIMDLWTREARLFKYGSGTGTNFSSLRSESEPLAGGGRSSGLMSFLKIGDRAAGAIKSGGTTRRAAKMVICDMDHPDIESFINWKVKEEQKVAALVAGSKMHAEKLNAIFDAIRGWDGSITDATDPRKLRQARAPVRRAGLCQHRISGLRHGLGLGGLSQRLGPELQQLGPGDRCIPQGGGGRRRLGADPAHGRQGGADRQGARPVGADRPRRLGLRRPRHPVSRHDQRLAHLPGCRADPRVQPVL
jgi:ribonucleoside-diphosphate reductase alpha chain